MTAPLVKPHVTYEQLCDMPSDGHRWELIEGEAYMSPSPSRRHQELVLRIVLAFARAIRDRGQVFVAPLDTVLAEATALQPDVIFVSEQNAAVLQDVIRGAPDLVVEVLSPSTAAFDRGPKLEAYARYGVGECWLIDDQAGAVEVYWLESGTRSYRKQNTFRRGDTVTTPLLPSLSLEIASLFS
jgi:Uma2 family endonuclease